MPIDPSLLTITIADEISVDIPVDATAAECTAAIQAAIGDASIEVGIGELPVPVNPPPASFEEFAAGVQEDVARSLSVPEWIIPDDPREPFPQHFSRPRYNPESRDFRMEELDRLVTVRFEVVARARQSIVNAIEERLAEIGLPRPWLSVQYETEQYCRILRARVKASARVSASVTLRAIRDVHYRFEACIDYEGVPVVVTPGSIGDFLPHRPPDETLEAIRQLPRAYHPRGMFVDREGKCFDVLFPELFKDPSLPRHVFPQYYKIEAALNCRLNCRRERLRSGLDLWDSFD